MPGSPAAITRKRTVAKSPSPARPSPGRQAALHRRHRGQAAKATPPRSRSSSPGSIAHGLHGRGVPSELGGHALHAAGAAYPQRGPETRRRPLARHENEQLVARGRGQGGLRLRDLAVVDREQHEVLELHPIVGLRPARMSRRSSVPRRGSRADRRREGDPVVAPRKLMSEVLTKLLPGQSVKPSWTSPRW